MTITASGVWFTYRKQSTPVYRVKRDLLQCQKRGWFTYRKESTPVFFVRCFSFIDGPRLPLFRV